MPVEGESFLFAEEQFHYITVKSVTMEKKTGSSTVNVVILTYNNRVLLERGLQSIQRAIGNAKTAGRITVVDNNSSDGTAEMISERFPEVHYLRNSENLGTARGFNRGIESGFDADFTMLLNDDVELLPDTIASMLEVLKAFPRAMGIAAHPMYPDGRSQRVKLKVIGGLKRIQDERVRTVEFSGTTACLYHTDVFRKLGLFDEFYFFYNEDLDFALRAKREGMQFILDPSIKVKHHLHQGQTKGKRAVRPHFHVANYYFYRKHYGCIAAALYYLSAIISIGRALKNADTEEYQMLLRGRDALKYVARHYRECMNSPYEASLT
jgi:GT2 family glycosyltransferase